MAEKIAEILETMSTGSMSVVACMRVYADRKPEAFMTDAIEAVELYDDVIDEAKRLLTVRPDPGAYKAVALKTQRHALFFGNLAVLGLVEEVADIKEGNPREVLLFSQLIEEVTKARDAIKVIFQFCSLAGRDICGRPLSS